MEAHLSDGATRVFDVPYSSPWWWSILRDREEMRIRLVDEIEIVLERSADPGILQPLGADRLDRFSLPLARDQSSQVRSRLLNGLEAAQASGVYIPHVPAYSPLLSVAVMRSREWEARIWPQSTMVCAHSPRKRSRNGKLLSRLDAVERRRREFEVHVVDCTDWAIGEKVNLFLQVAGNSPHPEWHLPWLDECDSRLAGLLDHRNGVRSRMLAAFNDTQQCYSLLVGFQIKDRLFVYKSITTFEGRKAFAGLIVWADLETSMTDWRVGRLFLGIGLHYYKRYWSEWAEPQLGVLIQHRREAGRLRDDWRLAPEQTWKLEHWSKPD